MTPQILRGYQREMLEAIQHYLEDCDGNGIVVSPTGTGKSLVCNAAIRWAVEEFGARVMCITHQHSIISQNCDSMIRYWPRADVGLYSASLKQWNTRSQITYCGVQSVHKCPEEFGHIDLLIVDECHMLGPRDGTMYSKVLKALKKTNPAVRIIGFSASPYRLGQGLLTEGEIFDDIIIDLSKTEKFCAFVDDGWLSPLYTKHTEKQIDLQNVPMLAGDFSEKHMALVADTADINKCIVRECIKYGSQRKHWLGFSSGLKHAEHIKDAFTSCGISCVVIDGGMSVEERDRLTKDFRSGKIRVVVNVGIFNVGWDFPELDLIFVARGTQSTAWWVQCLGRGTRAVYAPGMPLDTAEQRLAAIAAGPKPNGCLVLDFAGNRERLGPVNDPNIPKPRRKGDSVAGEAPTKVCPECSEYCHTRATECPCCGYQFPPASCLERTACSQEVMVKVSSTPEIAILEVLHTHYTNRLTKNPELGEAFVISYGSMIKQVSEYFFPQLPDNYKWLQPKFHNRWTEAGGRTPYPSTAEEAVSRARTELKAPAKVHYTSNTRHAEIRRREYV